MQDIYRPPLIHSHSQQATGSGVQHEIHSPNCCCVQAPSLPKWQNVRSSIVERALIGELDSDMLGRFEEKDEELDESKVLTTQLIVLLVSSSTELN